MVIVRHARAATQGMLMTELVIAMSILAFAVFPLGFSFIQEQKLCRMYYQRAVLGEILDGELEVLAAGDWLVLPDGTHPFSTRAESAVNLPPRRFSLTRQEHRLRLEWIPDSGGKPVAREIMRP